MKIKFLWGFFSIFDFLAHFRVFILLSFSFYFILFYFILSYFFILSFNSSWLKKLSRGGFEPLFTDHQRWVLPLTQCDIQDLMDSFQITTQPQRKGISQRTGFLIYSFKSLHFTARPSKQLINMFIDL